MPGSIDLQRDIQLCEAMVREGLITPDQVRTAVEYKKEIGGRLRDILTKLDFVSEKDLNRFLGRLERMQTLDIDGYEADPACFRGIPRKVIERHQAIPIRRTRNSILLGVSEPMDYEAVEEIKFLTNCKVETALAPTSQIRAAIARYYETHADEEPSSIEAELIGRIQDPVVAALARALVAQGLVDIDTWRREARNRES